MIVREEQGQAGVHVRYSGVTSATSFSSLLIHPPADAERFIPFSSGGTTTLSNGMIIYGATSAAYATICGVVLTAGTWAGGDAAGIFFLKGQSGTFQAENCDTDATAAHDLVTIPSNSIPFIAPGQQAQKVFLSCQTASMSVTTDGSTPTVSGGGGTDMGIYMSAGQTWVLTGTQTVKNIKFINTVASNGSVLKADFYY